MEIPPRPVPRFGYINENSDHRFQANLARMWETINSVRTGTISPSSGANDCYTWISDIVSGRCLPFDDALEPEDTRPFRRCEIEGVAEPGDTPGMKMFHNYFCGFLMMQSRFFENDEQLKSLVRFSVEYWGLLQTKKWIYRGETMENPSLALDKVFCFRCSNHHWPHESRGMVVSPPNEDYLIKEWRFLGMFRKHKSFPWMDRKFYELVAHGMSRRRFTNEHNVAVELLETVGAELYNLPETLEPVPYSYEFEDWNSRVHESWLDRGSGVGGFRKHWKEWIENQEFLLAKDDEREARKEERALAERALVVLRRVQEEQEAIDAAAGAD